MPGDVMKIRRIAIIGGGTAGWLAANHLGFELKAESGIEITVIESADIPTIGVGEGTVPYIKKSLEKFNISEAELIATCDVTFKQGIKFVDWLNPEAHGKGHYYYHPFEAPFPSGCDVTHYWLAARKELDFHWLTEQSSICDAMKSPKKISSLPYQGELGYAYHFDALKFAQLLARNAIKKFSIRHQRTTIVDAIKMDDGSIAALVDGEGNLHEFDFYIDCSGFSSLLIDKALSVPFVDKKSCILTDTALAFQLPTDEQAEIPPFTIATAHKAGWIWDIALPHRRGTGFVYSSMCMTESEAVEEFSKYLGVDADRFSPRKIPMQVGYRQQFWHKNCVAIGLAQGFVEPLEATSILISDFSAEYLARNFPRTFDDVAMLAKRYNKTLTYSWERVIDFVKLHYCISDRKDSGFWRENTNPETFSDVLRERLELWSAYPPQKSDFFSHFEVFNVENYLYVLYGMKYVTKTPSLSSFEYRNSQSQIELVNSRAEKLQKELLGHRDWLNKLKAAMGKSTFDY